MCLMTVTYTDECGGALLMEHVTELHQEGDAVVLCGLLDEPLRVDGVRVAAVDFARGRARLARVEAGA